MRRTFLQQAAALSAAALAAPFSFGQTGDYPNHPVRLIVPYPPGGSLDPIARVVFNKVGQLIGQPFIIENRPGANTAIAAGFINKADPDGYNLLFTSPLSHAIHTIQADRGYQAVSGFTPIAGMSRAVSLMVVNADLPVHNVAEVVAYAKANPGKISAAVSGLGASEHLALELFMSSTGAKFTVVPYKGGGPALLDTVAGRTQLMVGSLSTLQPQLDNGKLRAIAYNFQPSWMGPVPTMAQAGLQGFETFGLLTVVLGPPKLPAPIVNKLTGAIKEALEAPEVKTGILAATQVPGYMAPGPLFERLTNDTNRIADIIKKSGIKFE